MLSDLYQEVIIDHNRNPRNFGKLTNAATRTMEAINPLCGDQLTIYLDIVQDTIQEICFDGSGCAISIASASMMTDMVKGKTISHAVAIFNDFHSMLVDEQEETTPSSLGGKLTILANIRNYPSRVKCATLCWHALQSTLAGDHTPVSTE